MALVGSVVLGCTAAPRPTLTEPVAAPGSIVLFERIDMEAFHLSAPVGARSVPTDDGTVVTYSDPPFAGGAMEISVERHEPSDGELPGDFALIPARGAVSAPSEFVLDDPGEIVAARTFPIGPGRACADRVVVEGAVASPDGPYLIRVTTDAPGMCDARRTEITMTVLESFGTSR